MIRGEPFTIAEAAIIASGSFVLYFLRISIVFPFISFDRVISVQSFIKALVLYFLFFYKNRKTLINCSF